MELEDNMSTGMCLECRDIVYSAHRHDFVRCKCGKSFLDGGDDYFRAGGCMVATSEPAMTEEEFLAKLDEWS
jgi:hypothetical protein